MTITSITLYRKDIDLKEKNIEKQLCDAVRRRGGMCPKWVSPGLAGVPDRIILMPHGRGSFAEVKTSGKVPRPLQTARIRQLQDLGYRVYVIDDPEKIEGVLDEIQTL